MRFIGTGAVTPASTAELVAEWNARWERDGFSLWAVCHSRDRGVHRPAGPASTASSACRPDSVRSERVMRTLGMTVDRGDLPRRSATPFGCRDRPSDVGGR